MSSATKSQAKFEHPLFQEGIAYELARIINLLENYAQKELHRLRNPDTKVMSELHLAYYEGLLEAMFVIKGEQNHNESVAVLPEGEQE